MNLQSTIVLLFNENHSGLLSVNFMYATVDAAEHTVGDASWLFMHVREI